MQTIQERKWRPKLYDSVWEKQKRNEHESWELTENMENQDIDKNI